MHVVSSSWVHAIGYDAGRQRLYVTFKEKSDKLTLRQRHAGAVKVTVTCVYDDIDAELWYDFAHTGSKGKWVHSHLMHKNYRIV
jgi:hypothetical protein